MIDFSEYFPRKLPSQDNKIVRIEFHLDSRSDADIIKKLEKQKNKSEYIRKLIRKDIKGTK